MKRFLMAILVFAVITAIIAGVMWSYRNQIIKQVITKAATEVLGAKVQIEKVSLNVGEQSFSIEKLRVYNPEGYPDEVLLDMPEITVNYDFKALLKKDFHFPSIVINLEKIVLIKDKEGKWNFNSFKVMKEAKPEEEPTAEKKDAKPPEFRIDELTLTVGQVIVKDLGKGGLPTVHNVNIKEKKYKDITSAKKLVGLLMFDAMKSTGLKGAALTGITSLVGLAAMEVVAVIKVADMLIGKDSASKEFRASYEDAYNASLAVIREKGRVTKKRESLITGKVGSNTVHVRIRQKGELVKITVSARAIIIAKPKVAEGILYEISVLLE